LLIYLGSLTLATENGIVLNGKRLYAVTTGTTVLLFCVGLLQDSDVVFIYSGVDLNSSISLANYNISLSQNDQRIEIAFNNFTVDLNGNLSCQSRMSGRKQSVSIGGNH